MATVNNMGKNNTNHSGDSGILDIASGYDTNASPGPETLLKLLIDINNL